MKGESELFARSQLITLGQTEVRILCAEDHLRVICFHLMREGAGGRCGLLMWQRCWNFVREISTGITVCVTVVEPGLWSMPLVWRIDCWE